METDSIITHSRRASLRYYFVIFLKVWNHSSVSTKKLDQLFWKWGIRSVLKQIGQNLHRTYQKDTCYKLCQNEVYKVPTEVFNELTKYFAGLGQPDLPTRTPISRNIYLISYIHHFYYESSQYYGNCKNSKTYQKFIVEMPG